MVTPPPLPSRGEHQMLLLSCCCFLNASQISHVMKVDGCALSKGTYLEHEAAND